MIEITHIHPMLVHFPIVLFLVAVATQYTVLLKKGDLVGRQCLPMMGLGALLIGVLTAAAAALFGDIALDEAIDKGFQKDPLEEHETLGLTTLWIFVGVAVVLSVAWWRRIPLVDKRGWTICVIGIIGIGVLIAAAYHGGDLVYRLGVNVTPVKP